MHRCRNQYQNLLCQVYQESKNPTQMFTTDYWKSDILQWVIKTQNKRKMWRTTIKCQQTENPLSSYNGKQT